MYRITILPAVLHGCENSPLTLREHKSKVFENRVLRNIFGPKADELSGRIILKWIVVKSSNYKQYNV
jgi:hypothetical protein